MANQIRQDIEEIKRLNIELEKVQANLRNLIGISTRVATSKQMASRIKELRLEEERLQKAIQQTNQEYKKRVGTVGTRKESSKRSIPNREYRKRIGEESKLREQVQQTSREYRKRIGEESKLQENISQTSRKYRKRIEEESKLREQIRQTNREYRKRTGSSKTRTTPEGDVPTAESVISVPGDKDDRKALVADWTQIEKKYGDVARTARDYANAQLGVADSSKHLKRVQEDVNNELTNFKFRMGDVESGFKDLHVQVNKSNEVLQKGFSAKQLKNLGNEAPKVKKALEDIKGIKWTDLKSVSQEQSTKIKQWRFEAQDANGVIKRLSLTTDRFDNVLQDTQKRFRGFFSSLARNTAEVLKWTVAVQLIYRPMMKLYELTELMISNEAKLADITVVLGQEMSSTADAFQAAADVAALTGESINGVLESYELAFRAAGGIEDQNKRTAVSQQLLVDSMILSKVSALNQADALDTLAGALLQTKQQGESTAEALSRGRDLLDKWVAVSRRANVSVKTLAESFAITSTSASNAELSFDQLNGVIATVAENTTLSATEAGNAVRAFISGFQTDKAVNELKDFGIAVTSSKEGMLGFYDVMLQIKNLYDEGLISDAQLNRIAEAIGGGARRGAQVVATIKNLDRVNEVAKVSANAHGDAQEALAIKLDTVQTKVTELGNAFQILAQTLGTEGGVLDGIKVAVSGLTGLVNAINSVTDALGTSMPVLVAYGIAAQQLKNIGGMTGLQTLLSERGDKLASATSGLAGTKITSLGSKFLGWDVTLGKGMAKALNSPAVINGAISMGIIAAQAFSSFNAEEAERGWGQIAGGAIGGAVGAAIGAPIIGTTIGSVAGGAFADSVWGYETSFEKLFSGVIGSALQEAGEDVDEEDFTDISNWREEADAFSQRLIDKNPFEIWMLNAFADIDKFLPWTDFIPDKFTKEDFGIIAASEEWKNLSFGRGKDNKLFGIEGTGLTSVANLEEILQYYSELEKIEKGGEDTTLDLYKERNRLAEEYSGHLDNLTRKLKKKAQEEHLAGNITAKQLKDINDILPGLNTNLALVLSAIGEDNWETLGDDINSAEDAFDTLSDVIIYGAREDSLYIQELVGDIAILQKRLEDPELTKEREIEIKLDIQDASEEIAEVSNAIKQDLEVQRFELTPTIELPPGTTKKQLSLLERRLKRNQKIDLSSRVELGLLDEVPDQEVLEKVYGDTFLDIGRTSQDAFFRGYDQQKIKEEVSKMIDEGLLPKPIDDGGGVGIKEFDVSSQDFFAKVEQANQIAKRLDAKYKEYEPNYETFIPALKDGLADPLTVEAQILQMLLRDLIDVNEEQLEGVYNLPADSSFYVPFTGYALGQGGGGSGGAEQWFEALLAEEKVQTDLLRQQVLDTTELDRMDDKLAKAEEDAKKWSLEDIFPPYGIDWEMGKDKAPERQVPSEFRPDDIRTWGNVFEEMNQLKNPDITFQQKLETFTDSMMDSITSGIDKMIDFLANPSQWFGGGKNRQGEETSMLPSRESDIGSETTSSLQGLTSAIEQLQEAASQTRIQLELTSNTTLNLDGQMIAQQTKNFMHEEMVKRAEAHGAVTRRYTL